MVGADSERGRHSRDELRKGEVMEIDGEGAGDRSDHRRDERRKERRDDRRERESSRDHGDERRHDRREERGRGRERRDRESDRREREGSKERERRGRDSDRREREGSKERERRDRESDRREREDRERRERDIDCREREDRDRSERDRRREKEEGEHEREKESSRRKEDGRGKEHDRSSRAHERNEKDRDRVNDREREEKERAAQRGKEREKDRRKEKEKEKSSDGKEVDHELHGKDWESDAGGRKEVIMLAKKDMESGDALVTRRKSQELQEVGKIEVGQVSTEELRDRLAKMKEEREREKTEGASEILSWVSKSRKLEDQKNLEKEKAFRLSQALDEQEKLIEESEEEEDDSLLGRGKDMSTDHLAGVKILHGLDKVVEGGAVVFTLKDQDIITGGDVNEEVDMLENIEIGQQKKRDEAYKDAKKQGTYEDKFNNVVTQKPTLPLYDDPEEEEAVTLDQSGVFSGEAEKKLEELRRRIEGVNAQRASEDLSSTAKLTSDYYTTDEMLQFRKPKKKKSMRKKEKLDYDALEAEAIASGLGKDDFGSRNDLKRQSAKQEQEKAEADQRSIAYHTAIAKAEEASKVLRPEKYQSAKKADEDELVFGEDYEDMQRSLEQARKLALKKQDEASASGPQAVALLATARNNHEDVNSVEEESKENKVVITEMEEFVWGLQLNEETRKPEEDDVFMDEDPEPANAEEEPKAGVNGWTDVKENKNDESQINEESAEAEVDETIHEQPYGKGLFFALSLAKDRGTLSEGIEWGGRTTDKKKSKLAGIEDGPKDIRIDRVDEFGRIMTPKESFRVLSHRFHGKNPGKMKQEKRMKKYQEELKTKQMKASDTPLMSMEIIRETQARTKTPYLVLSGHVKPGQTSDPASGFATVEKDHLGSLTPMLGDKKVEHFLGIKRNSDLGKMGPPPPKKPKT